MTDQTTKQEQPSVLPPSSALVHLDSELTVTSSDNIKKGDNLGDKEEYYSTDKTDIDVEYATATVNPQDEQPVLVDGPVFGWIVVLASFTSQMISMGVCNVYGVYQVQYMSNCDHPFLPLFFLLSLSSTCPSPPCLCIPHCMSIDKRKENRKNRSERCSACNSRYHLFCLILINNSNNWFCQVVGSEKKGRGEI